MKTTAALNATIGERAPTRLRPILSLWLVPIPVMGFLLFGSTGRDDAYITYWAADQLRRTGRITNYNGSAVEQSSSLLHVLILAAASWVTRIPVTSVGPWLAVFFGALCAPVAFWLCDRLDARGRWTAAALVATLPPLVYWSFGGLETSLATFLVLLALTVMIRVIEGASTSKVGLTLLLLAVVLVRPEMGPVFVVALLVAAIAVRWFVPASWRGADGCDRAAAARRVFLVALVTVVGVVLVALFRKAYFGAWVPRPVTVKTGTPHIKDGFLYVVDTLAQSRTFIAVFVGALLIASRCWRLTPGWLIAGALVATGTVAVIEPGGDWMEGGRLLAPWLAVAVVLVAASLGRLPNLPRVLVASALIVVNGAGLFTYAEHYSTGVAAWTHLAWTDEHNRVAARPAPDHSSFWERRNALHARDELFVRDALPVFAALEQVMAPRRVVYASSQAGMVVYYLQQDAVRRGTPFRFIDQYGLVDGTWDRCRRGIASSVSGKRVSWGRVFTGRCGGLPDVISGRDTDPNFGLSGLASRYKVFDLETGYLSPAAWPKSAPILGRQWLAIRDDLAPRVRTRLRRNGASL